MGNLRGPLWAALLFSLILAVAHAEEPLASARALLEDTLKTAEQLLLTEPDDLQLRFIRGMALAGLGRYLEAADEFRWMLARDPSLMRPRLELARVLMLSGQYDGAKYNFEQVLANDLPDDVRRNVLNVLARLRERTAAVTVLLELISDSNPSQGTSAKEVKIDGLRYRVNEDGRGKGSTGVRLAFDGRLPLFEDSLWFVRGIGEVEEYSDKESNFRYLQLSGGKNFHFARRTLTIEAGGHASSFAGSALYDGAVVAVSDYYQVRPDMALKVGIAGYQFSYHDYPYLSGWQYIASAEGLYAPSPTSRWEVLVGIASNHAEEEPYSYLQGQGAGRYVMEFVGGWIVGAGLSGAVTQYSEADPFFGETRRDLEKRVQLDFSNRRVRFWKLTPRVQVGHVDRQSNLDLYSFHRTYARIGLAGDF